MRRALCVVLALVLGALVLSACVQASVSGSTSKSESSSIQASSHAASASHEEVVSSVPVSSSAGVDEVSLEPAAPPEGSELVVRFVDVGQGDCILISCDGHHALIDGGPSKASQKVYTVLRDLGVETLDFIIATHADADHIGGISAAYKLMLIAKSIVINTIINHLPTPINLFRASWHCSPTFSITSRSGLPKSYAASKIFLIESGKVP